MPGGIEYKETILETVGNTPLVRLGKISRGLKPLILGKIESLNPGGSVKDRIGIRLVEAAEEAGLLKPGGTIVESTANARNVIESRIIAPNVAIAVALGTAVIVGMLVEYDATGLGEMPSGRWASIQADGRV